MKTKTLSTVFFLIMFINNISAQNDRKLEITVSYEHQDGMGSNQYAVWIEDSVGKFVKTLYVTNFTAKGGYISRPGCIPQWVEKAGAKNLSEEQIDAFSGATPKTGNHTYIWDLTDEKGNKVTSGEYTFIVQGTYNFPESQVLFKGNIDLAAVDEVVIETTPEYSADETKNKGMISNVTAKYIK